MSRVVIDQPGFRIFSIGLVLSLFIGLALRSQITETRVQVYINKAVDRIQNDFNVDYESAKVSLTRWGLPFPALVVQKIRLSPKSLLCQNSQIYAEELEVPISIFTILGISRVIPKIRINKMELRISDIEKCIAQNSLNSPDKNLDKNLDKNNRSVAEVVDSEIKTTTEAGLKNIFSNQTKAELREIYIEKLKIISDKKTDQPVLLKQVNLELSYADHRLSEVNIKAKLNALKDARSEIYFLNTDLVALFRAKENNQVESVININGKLLDGDARLFAHSKTGSNSISYELILEHVSAKAFGPMIDDFGAHKSINIEKTPISISFVNSGKIILNNKMNLESQFKDIQINVENGLLSANEIELGYNDSHIFIKPFKLKIESLALSNLKNIDNFKNKLDSFESLGRLSGYFEYKNENSYMFTGNVKNIQAVFSNRGRRDLQMLEQVDIKVTKNFDNLRLEAFDFLINGVKSGGNFWFQYNFNSSNITAQLKIKEVTLNEKIWEQFTFVEQLPKIRIQWNYQKLNHEEHNIKIYADKIFLPGLQLTGLNVDIKQVLSDRVEDNSLSVTLRPTNLSSEPSFIENKLVSQILNIKNGFTLNSLDSNKTDLVIMGSDWKNINFSLNSFFSSEPGVKSETHLAFKGSIRHNEGINAKIMMQKHNSLFKFDVTKNLTDEIIIKRVQ